MMDWEIEIDGVFHKVKDIYNIKDTTFYVDYNEQTKEYSYLIDSES